MGTWNESFSLIVLLTCIFMLFGYSIVLSLYIELRSVIWESDPAQGDSRASFR